MIDLSSYSIADLRKLADEVAGQIKSRGREEIAAAQQRILEVAKNLGMSVEQILGAKEPKQRQPAAARFKHPSDSTRQWSGRGRQPRWVKEHLDAGNTLESLLIS